MSDSMTAEELIGKDSADDLRVLSPAVILALASMGEAESTMDEMTATLQLFPDSDRAKLAANGYIAQQRDGWVGNRWASDIWMATPDMVELAETAHRLKEHLTKKPTGHDMLKFLDGE